jgi:hypothetical protein
MKIILGDFSAKLGKEGIFKPTVWGAIDGASNDSGVGE